MGSILQRHFIFLAILICTIVGPAKSENFTLEEVIQNIKEECANDIKYDSSKIPIASDYLINDNYFYVPHGAIETFIISESGIVAHLFSPHKSLCRNRPMNGLCGSSGCDYSLIVNNEEFNLRGKFVEIVNTSVGPVLLVGRSGSNCGLYSNAAPCVQAYIWDEENRSLNKMGN